MALLTKVVERLRLLAIAFVLTLFSLNAHAVSLPGFKGAASKCGEPPTEWREYLKYDQDHNVPGREPLTVKEKKTQYLYEFQVDAERVTHTTARRDPKIKSAQVPLYVAESWTPYSLSKLKKIVGAAPAKVLCAQRVQSGSTVFVWDPAGERKPFFAKHRDSNRDVAKIAKLFEDSLKRSNANNIRFLPEVEYTELATVEKTLLRGSNPVTLRSLVREAEVVGAVGEAPGRAGVKLLPLHGFLGSELVGKAAAANHMSIDAWMKTIYLPAIAAYSESLHFDVGFGHAGHSQNLLIEFNEKTGRIENFVLRDMHDLQPDYFQLMTRKNAHISERAALEGLNHFVLEEGSEMSALELSKPGTHFVGYSLQSISSFEDRLERQARNIDEFLNQYIKRTEERLGHPLFLSREIKALREEIATTGRTAFIESEMTEAAYSKLRQSAAQIINAVHDEVALARAKVLPINEDPGFQTLARKAFFESQKKTTIAYATGAAAELGRNGVPGEWRYAYDGKRIFALDANNHAIAATFQIEPATQAKLDLAIPRELLCPHLFSEVRR